MSITGSNITCSPDRVRIGGEVLALRIAVAGNPNSGKSTIFNALTGAHQHVGNYSGVTVEKKEGIVHHDGREVIFIDLPGTYSLDAYSPEERIAMRTLLDGSLQAVLYVADAGLLERSLLLAVQIREIGLPVVIACNMMDEVRKNGQDIDFLKLSASLGAHALPTIGPSGEGVDEAFHAVERLALREQGAPLTVSYGPLLDPALEELSAIVSRSHPKILRTYGPVSSRWLALKLIENEETAWAAVAEASKTDVSAYRAVEKVCSGVRNRLQQEKRMLEDVIAEHRFAFSRQAVESCMTNRSAGSRLTLTDRLDRVLVHSVLGAAVMLAVLWSMFNLVIEVGAYPQEWLESAFTWLGDTVRNALPEGLLASLLVDGVINGLGSVLSFVPLIVILFAIIAFLEDSGYMARMAYLADRIFHFFGLQGASVMPYIIAGGIAGGCAIPGVMATRTMRSPKEKLATMLTLPYMACGAKLPVVLLLAGTFAPAYSAGMLFAAVMFGWFMALAVSLLLRQTLLRGESTPLVMEMPPYRWPTLRGIAIHCWERTWMYLRKAGVVLLPVSILLWAAMTFPSLDPLIDQHYSTLLADIESRLAAPDLQDDARQTLESRKEEVESARKSAALRNSIAGRMGMWMEKFTAAAGFDWRTDVALIGGIAAKEVIVSTMGTAYSLSADVSEDDAPLRELLAKDKSWNLGSAAALLVFVLLYSPCFVTLVVMKEESGTWKWVFFSIFFNTAIAYGIAVAINRTFPVWGQWIA